MKLFEKRPLSLILCIILGAFSLFANFSLTVGLIAISVSLAALVFTLLSKPKIITNLRLFIVAAFALVFAVILSHLYFGNFYPVDWYEKEVYITGEVTDIERTENYYAKYTVETDSVDGEKENYKLLVYGDKTASSDFSLGNKIAFSGTVKELGKDESGFDSRSYYTARGYSATVISVKDISLLDSRVQSDFERFFQEKKTGLIDRFYSICDGDTASLLTALLLGERSTLDASVQLNFTRTGITHILALSGMHLVILAGALSLLFAKFNKKLRLVTVMIFTFLYMTLTGFAPSVTRAGIMLIVSTLLFLCALSKDGVTNLCLAVFIIVLFEPYAIYDISLWLSAFATLGVIIYAELTRKRKRAKNFALKTLFALSDGILVSLFAISSTLIFTLYNFDAFSLIAPFTTLLFSFIITPYMYLGLIVLAFGSFIPFIAEVASRYTLFIARAIDCFSDFKSIYVSYALPFVKILIIVLTVSFFLFLILDIKKKRYAVAIICVLFLFLNLTAFIGTRRVINEDAILYENIDNADCFLIKSEKENVLILAGEPDLSSAFLIVDFITDKDITYLDRIYMPVTTEYNLKALNVILSSVYTYELFIPEPTCDTEAEVALKYAEFLSERPTKLNFTSEQEPQKVGEYFIHHLLSQTSSKKGECAFIIDCGSEIYTYVNSTLFVKDFGKVALILNVSDTVIVGSYGEAKEFTTSYRLQKAKRILLPDNILFDNDTSDYYEALGTSTEYVKGAVLYVE